MENLEQPMVNVSNHQREYRLTILNTRKSAIAGTLLMVLPFLFLSGVILKHYLRIDLGILTSVYSWISLMDAKFGDISALNWLIRLLLTIGPLVAIAINLLAVMHAHIDKANKEFVLAFKMKWLNWSIILICTVIFAIFFLYFVLENA